MFTKMFKKLSEIIAIPNNAAGVGYYQFKNVRGDTKYISNYVNNSVYPALAAYGFTTAPTTYGIVLGSGTTQPTENDYQIESPITSGITVSINNTHIYENNGSRHIMDLMVTNTSSSPITISEIGWSVGCYASKSQNQDASYNASNNANNTVFLADRTLLTNPVTIPAKDYAVIRYTLGESASAA